MVQLHTLLNELQLVGNKVIVATSQPISHSYCLQHSPSLAAAAGLCRPNYFLITVVRPSRARTNVAVVGEAKSGLCPQRYTPKTIVACPHSDLHSQNPQEKVAS